MASFKSKVADSHREVRRMLGNRTIRQEDAPALLLKLVFDFSDPAPDALALAADWLQELDRELGKGPASGSQFVPVAHFSEPRAGGKAAKYAKARADALARHAARSGGTTGKSLRERLSAGNNH